MAVARASLVISAKPDVVWGLVGDLTRHPDWAADSLEITKLDEGRYTTKTRSRGRTFTAAVEVIELIPERLIEFQVTDTTGSYLHTIELAAQGGGTLVSRKVIPQHLSVAQRLVGMVVLLPVRLPNLRKSLERLADAAPGP